MDENKGKRGMDLSLLKKTCFDPNFDDLVARFLDFVTGMR